VIKWLRLSVVLGLLGLCGRTTTLLHAQMVERDTKITGPRGRTINRQVDIERGPGTFQRQVQIQRPGGTLERSTTIQRGWGGFPGGGFGGFRPLPFFAGPRPVTSWGLGITAAPIITIPFFGGGGFGVGGGAVAGPGMGGAGMGMAAGGGAGPGGAPGGQPGPAAQPNPLDPVVLAAQKLQSFHASSRRDGARELGQLGDPRAIPPLVHTLKNDSAKDVRAAAATSLGELGGSEAEVVLERCIIYEKKQEVKDAAAAALRLLRERRAPDLQVGQFSQQPLSRSAPMASPNQTQQSVVPRLATPLPSPDPRSSPFRPQAGSQEPPLDGPSPDTAAPSDAERVPPPPPTPVKPD
jgi:HEAT repeats